MSNLRRGKKRVNLTLQTAFKRADISSAAYTDCFLHMQDDVDPVLPIPEENNVTKTADLAAESLQPAATTQPS